MREVFIHSFGRFIGSTTSVQSYCGDKDKTALNLLKEDGFETFVTSEKCVVEMAAKAIATSLESLPVSRDDVDGLIISTESFWDAGAEAEQTQTVDHLRLRERFLGVIFKELSLKVNVYANWLSGCSNFVTTLNLAASLVRAGQHRNIVVVWTDRAHPKFWRVMGSGITIFSDVAVSFVVSTSPIGYRVKNIISAGDREIYLARSTHNTLLQGKYLLAHHRHLNAKYNAITGRTCSECQFIVTDNFHSALLDFVYQGFEVTRSRVLTPTKAAFGHAFASDCPLSLCHLDDLGKGQIGQEILLINMGPWSTGLVLVERM